MTEYEDKFPVGLDDEARAALVWKIEGDYQRSNLGALTFKDEYITFAVNFYTRNHFSLEDVVGQYRAHERAERRKSLAEAFVADMKHKLHEPEEDAVL